MALTRYQTAIVVAPTGDDGFVTDMIRPICPVNVPQRGTVKITEGFDWEGGDEDNIESMVFYDDGWIVVRMKCGAEARFMPAPTLAEAVTSKQFLYFKFSVDGSIEIRDRNLVNFKFGTAVTVRNWAVKRFHLGNDETGEWTTYKARRYYPFKEYECYDDYRDDKDEREYKYWRIIHHQNRTGDIP